MCRFHAPDPGRWDNEAVIRSAGRDDFEAIARLYAQLNVDDPPVSGPAHIEVFEQILDRDGLDIVLLELDGEVLGATYLNVIPNLSRGGRPYAVIENVVIAAHRRGEKLGRRLMDATLDRAWVAGCYKAMLQTGSRTPSTHAYYRACGFADDAKVAYLARPPD
ncbi:MAG: GNAT family N-acetyltransferase [Actinobacteria bacterium]|nr:GNAT family N-acetyltransferase [Actinomycetota bacterium]